MFAVIAVLLMLVYLIIDVAIQQPLLRRSFVVVVILVGLFASGTVLTTSRKECEVSLGVYGRLLHSLFDDLCRLSYEKEYGVLEARLEKLRNEISGAVTEQLRLARLVNDMQFVGGTNAPSGKRSISHLGPP